MSETESSEKPAEKPSIGKKVKDALDHGKSLGTAIVLLLTAGTTVYHFFRPEQEARSSYQTLKPVVERTANDVNELRMRLDYYEKMLLLGGCSRRTLAAEGEDERPPSSTKPVRVRPSLLPEPAEPDEPAPPSPAETFIERALQQTPVDLPDAPWEQKKR